MDEQYCDGVLERIRTLVQEIGSLEREHTYELSCSRFAPGRCPLCLRIRLLEQDEIEREVLKIEEELIISLQQEASPAHTILALTRALARADVYRCHPRGQWPRSVAEADDTRAIFGPMLRRRLEVRSLAPDHRARLDPLLRQLVQEYRRSYHVACLERWPLPHFEHYTRPGQLGDLPLSWCVGPDPADIDHDERRDELLAERMNQA